ncbi:hypothetical protein EMIHUDRAFT_240400 [Emiliania huxleyi CCMP1516]|uniref:Peptidase M14 domain-containing protein n=2 Tax=Emiliania huxleyi TaxID=2903 RepID=A0A0D3JFU2_EMIH1|nr:hypothetical protein EMIHUDRAFT_240400 [Emiliania huxleyi CCMP1516]EOD22377.1 hypothetical protein EMIHUDRAFT_240400 [Emiliania huxleyi CCMP1516]|eukprot:XP_005774806.1 hypothetical protein EMIHUDRAFT_240400 [Emiliania huxleyi CCMP1516]
MLPAFLLSLASGEGGGNTHYFAPGNNHHDQYSRETDRWWRKTRSPNAGSSCVGTDPNRNWAHRAWGGVPGSSTNPCSDVYHGSRAGSEPEVERIQQFVTQFGTEADGSSHFKLFIDYHTYSQMWLYPWGYLYSAAPHDDEHDALSAAAVAAIRGVHGKQYTYGPAASTIYVTTGDSTDWAYDPIEARPPTPDWAYIKHAYTIEGRDTGGYGFVAPASEISNSFSVVVPIAVGVSSPSYNPSQCVNTQFTGQDPVYWLKLEDVRPGVALELTACGFDTDLSIFRGSCDSLEQVACDGDSLDDEGSCSVSYGSLIDTYWNGVTCGTLEELLPPRICTACDYPTEVWNGQACVLLSDYNPEFRLVAQPALFSKEYHILPKIV